MERIPLVSMPVGAYHCPVRCLSDSWSMGRYGYDSEPQAHNEQTNCAVVFLDRSIISGRDFTFVFIRTLGLLRPGDGDPCSELSSLPGRLAAATAASATPNHSHNTSGQQLKDCLGHLGSSAPPARPVALSLVLHKLA